MRRTMVNASTDWWRRKPWRERSTAELPEQPVPDPSGGYDTRDAVLRALAALSPRQRAVIVLRYYEGLSEAEIAATLGCSAGTVKSAASRAKATLRGSPELARERSAP